MGNGGKLAVMKREVLIAAVILGVLLAPVAGTIELPPAPAGYLWRSIEDIQSAFLVPASWHFKEVRAKGTRSFFITRENIDERGGFETGLTINFVQKGDEFDPVAYAAALVLEVVEHNEVLEEPFEAGGGTLKGYGCRVRTVTGAGPLIMQHLVIGNAKTGSLFVMFFESPEEEWEKAWAIAEPMMTLFVLGDEA